MSAINCTPEEASAYHTRRVAQPKKGGDILTLEQELSGAEVSTGKAAALQTVASCNSNGEGGGKLYAAWKTKGGGGTVTGKHLKLREWRKVEREIGTALTRSLLSQGFSEGDIARLGPEAWSWAQSDELQALLDQLAHHIGVEMEDERAFQMWLSSKVAPPKPKTSHYGSNTIHLVENKEAK